MNIINNIVLIGFMGTGKSTVAQKLAETLGWLCIDTDEQLEQEAGRSISDIFAKEGEAYFRRLETSVLKRVLSSSKQIVSTGGGAVLASENREIMLENGFVVALTAKAEVIIGRVKSDPGRPLLQGDVTERVQTMLERRRNAYDFAHAAIDTSDMSINEIADCILHLCRAKEGEA